MGLEEIQAHTQKLSHQLRAGLSQISGLRVLDRGSKLASIVTFTKAGISLDQMEQYLKENDIVYSVSARNFALIDFTNKNVDWAIRLSPHYFNTVEEIEQVKEVLMQS
ncbi:MAG: aminotransferase class V-fold PLP-dependent enzyme [Cyclobacteriaceae bacterium]